MSCRLLKGVLLAAECFPSEERCISEEDGPRMLDWIVYCRNALLTGAQSCYPTETEAYETLLPETKKKG